MPVSHSKATLRPIQPHKKSQGCGKSILMIIHCYISYIKYPNDQYNVVFYLWGGCGFIG